MTNTIRENFDHKCERAINEQINMELNASYVYLSMANYFNRSDISLIGLNKFFLDSSIEEREHAMKLLYYMNKRGGEFQLADIKSPEKSDWGTADEAMQHALHLEMNVNRNLLKLHDLALELHDANLTEFLEKEFLQHQVDSIKEISDHLTNLKLVGNGSGVYVFDKELLIEN